MAVLGAEHGSTAGWDRAGDGDRALAGALELGRKWGWSLELG